MSNMIQCLNPKLCGVKQHHAGTEAPCFAGQGKPGGPTPARITRLFGVSPKVTSARRPTQPEPVSHDRVVETLVRHKKDEAKFDKLSERATLQAQDFMRNFTQAPHEYEVDVDSDTIMSGDHVVRATITPPHDKDDVQVVEAPKDYMFPSESLYSELVSKPQIEAMVDRRNRNIKERHEIVSQVGRNLRNYVNAELEGSGYAPAEQISWNINEVLGESKGQIMVRVLKDGSEVNYVYAPHEAAFPG